MFNILRFIVHYNEQVTNLNAIAWQFVRVGSTHNVVPLNAGVSHLAGHILVGQTDDQAVLRCVVLVLVLL